MGQLRYFRNQPSTSQGRAVLYLRVSTTGQVNTDYDPEGISIPAQRRRCVDKARELGLEIIDEYVEPGRSATAIAKRPVFQQMLKRISGERDVDYIIVYSTSRMNRNWMENGAVLVELRALGVSMISATENIDDTPLGVALTGFLAVANGFQSAMNGQDIKYKMGQKARIGGTLTKAPLGYLNVTDTFEGRKVRTVAIDPERAPLVKLAFELYATGRYGFRELRERLTEAGLRSRPTVKYPAGTPISIHTVGSLLRNRYYTGVITYEGQDFPGRHEAIIEPELFERVQQVLFDERGAGTRQRQHNHYLKGLLWCARCQRRLILNPGRSHTGTQYLYFMCRGRQDKSCDLPHLPVDKVEAKVIGHYATVPLPPQLIAKVRERAEGAAAVTRATDATLQTSVRQQLAALDKKEDDYLDLLGDPDWPQDKLRERLREVRRQQAQLRQQLDRPEANIDRGRVLLLATLDLLERPQELYRLADEIGRQMLNKAIFNRLYLDHDGTDSYVAADELNEPFASVVAYRRRRTTYYRQENKNGAQAYLSAVPDDQPLVDLLDAALRERGLSKAIMVEHGGVEPPTSAMRTQRSTN